VRSLDQDLLRDITGRILEPRTPDRDLLNLETNETEI